MLPQYSINGVLRSLVIVVPEFGAQVSESIKVDEGYWSFEDFADFVKALIDKDGSPELIDRCYNYINILLEETSEKNVEEWLYVTFLESMVQGSVHRRVSRLKLNGKALLFFDAMIASGHWRIDR